MVLRTGAAVAIVGAYVNGKTVFVTKVLATQGTNKDLVGIQAMDFQVSFVIGGLTKAFGTMLTLPSSGF
jgi:hypothetical protein